MIPENAARMLKTEARHPKHSLYGQPNPGLDAVILWIRTNYPALYHTEASLNLRVFVDQPKSRVPGTWIRAGR